MKLKKDFESIVQYFWYIGVGLVILLFFVFFLEKQGWIPYLAFDITGSITASFLGLVLFGTLVHILMEMGRGFKKIALRLSLSLKLRPRKKRD